LVQKLRQKFVENIGLDDSKPLPQANAGEMFFYRESVDVDYSMEFSDRVGHALRKQLWRRGGDVCQQIIKASTIDTLKFLHEVFRTSRQVPDEVAFMANAQLLKRTRAMSSIR